MAVSSYTSKLGTDFAIFRNSPDREISFPGTGNFFGTRENRVPLTSLLSSNYVDRVQSVNSMSNLYAASTANVEFADTDDILGLTQATHCFIMLLA